MDVTKHKEQLAKVEKQISEYTVKLRVTEQRLRAEHEGLRSLVSQRAQMLARLADANTEDAQKINKNLDELDSQIRGTERRAESLQALVKTINSAMAELGNEHEKLSEVIAAEVNAEEFEAWKVQVAQARQDAEAAFADARIKLAALDTLCARGGARFGGPAYNVAAATFEDLLTRQANLEQNGWKLSVPVYRADAIVHIRPLIRR